MSNWTLRACGLTKRFDLSRSNRSMVGRLSELLNPQRLLTIGKSNDEQFTAVDDLTFEIQQGDVLGLIGRNGAGKSTLLKMLARIYRASSGYADIRGRLNALIEVGVGFHPELTGRENVFLNGAILGISQRDVATRFDEIVAFAEIEKFIDLPLKKYSSGMAVRLGFAVATCIEPDVLILDEALAVGDASFQQKCQERIRRFQQSGHTVVLVSHNMSMVSSMCNKVLYLDQGRLKAIGDTSEVIEQYFNDCSHTDMNASIDRNRARWLGQARTRFLDVKNGSQRTLTFGQDLRIVCRLYSEQREEAASLGLAVVSSDGIILFTLYTDEVLTLNEDEEVEIELIVSDVNLAPGSYWCNFGIGRGGLTSVRSDLDLLLGIVPFEVLPFDSKGNGISGWQAHEGRIIWTHHELKVLSRVKSTATASTDPTAKPS